MIPESQIQRVAVELGKAANASQVLEWLKFHLEGLFLGDDQ
jgi:hypothetical protein